MWSWGSSKFGQLGSGEMTAHLQPTLIKDIAGIAPCIGIACGEKHSLCLLGTLLDYISAILVQLSRVLCCCNVSHAVCRHLSSFFLQRTARCSLSATASTVSSVMAASRTALARTASTRLCHTTSCRWLPAGTTPWLCLSVCAVERLRNFRCQWLCSVVLLDRCRPYGARQPRAGSTSILSKHVSSHLADFRCSVGVLRQQGVYLGLER